MPQETYINSGSIRTIRPILESWTEVLQKYIDVHTEGKEVQDTPWLYNERAILSTFAVAAWKAEGAALEEYNTYKKGKEDKKTDSLGRCDLYFTPKNYDSFICEAKLVWCPLTNRRIERFTKIYNKLIEAEESCKRLSRDEGRRLALCFAIPYIQKADQERTDEFLDKWFKEITDNENKAEYSSVAWYFPEKTRQFLLEDDQIYPGVALLVKEI